MWFFVLAALAVNTDLGRTSFHTERRKQGSADGLVCWGVGGGGQRRYDPRLSGSRAPMPKQCGPHTLVSSGSCVLVSALCLLSAVLLKQVTGPLGSVSPTYKTEQRRCREEPGPRLQR